MIIKNNNKVYYLFIKIMLFKVIILWKNKNKNIKLVIKVLIKENKKNNIKM
jgi:hypothetical protein